MPRRHEELAVGEWAVLALLAEGESHGFAIARAMAPGGEVGKVWSVRRPLVYRAIDTLAAMELVRAAGTVASTSGPQRTVLQATAGGKRAVARWLRQPVEHVRDARSLLVLTLLFLARREADRALVLWRLERTTAAVRFVEAMRAEPARSR
jgi:DNA-binding PadR family transcriptional regulator